MVGDLPHGSFNVVTEDATNGGYIGGTTTTNSTLPNGCIYFVLTDADGKIGEVETIVPGP